MLSPQLYQALFTKPINFTLALTLRFATKLNFSFHQNVLILTKSKRYLVNNLKKISPWIKNNNI